MADTISPAYALADSVLTGDSTFMSYVSGVYQKTIPAGTYTKPWCVMQMQSAPIDTNSASGDFILARGILTVKIVGKASDGATIRAAFSRADDLLFPSGRPRRVGDGNSGGLLNIYRTGTIDYDEVDGGIQYVHLGGQYRYEI